MIRFENVSFSYAEKNILSKLTTEFESGKCHVVLGPSGSGKSTLLKLIAGLLKPSSGQISTTTRYGYVLQEGGLFQHLNIQNNISIQAQMLKWSSTEIKARISQLCELTRFPENLLLKFPNQISGGQRQRVSLMRALFMHPDVLLLDESLSALDPLLKYSLMNDLKEIIQALKKTTIMVTHDLMEASVLGNRILLLHDGVIQEDASKEEFFHSPKTDFAKMYIQSQKVAE